MMSHLHLLLSRLPERSPSLKRLLTRGKSCGLPPLGQSSALCNAFGLEPAIASHLFHAEVTGLDGDSWWRADPVHMLAGMHSINLLDSSQFHLDAAEAEEMVAALNDHFAGEAQFLAPHPQRWYARFDRPLDACSLPLDELVGTPIDPSLISGPDAARLQRFAMEAQMLLHSLPINEQREEAGVMPVNGLWFWGGGPTVKPRSTFDRVWADGFTARALAKAAGIACQPPPSAFETAPGHTLAVLDGIAPDRLETAWLTPLLSALKWGGLKSMMLEIVGPSGCRLQLGRAEAFSFWRGFGS